MASSSSLPPPPSPPPLPPRKNIFVHPSATSLARHTQLISETKHLIDIGQLHDANVVIRKIRRLCADHALLPNDPNDNAFASDGFWQVIEDSHLHLDKQTLDSMGATPLCVACLKAFPIGILLVTECGHIYCYLCMELLRRMHHPETSLPCHSCPSEFSSAGIFPLHDAEQKRDIVVGYLKHFIDHNPNFKAVVFSEFPGALMGLKVALTAAGIVSLCCGSRLSEQTRVKTVSSFQNENKAKIFLCDLTIIDHFEDFDFDLSSSSAIFMLNACPKTLEDKAVDLVHRNGPPRNGVPIFRFITKGTIEEFIFDMNKEFPESDDFSEKDIRTFLN